MKVLQWLMILLVLPGCAAWVPQLETPQLSIVNVELLSTELWEQRLKLRLRVQNPNSRALPIQGLSYALAVMDQDVARGVSANSFTVPAFGEAEFDTLISANMAGTLLKLFARKNAVGDAVPYRIKGKISLSEGWLRSIPFEDKGSFNLR